MDKNLLELFRKLFAVDNEVLPDSMTPEDFGKFIESQQGKLFFKPEDFKNLQKKLSEKDLKIKELTAKTKNEEERETSEITELSSLVKELTETVSTMKNDKKIAELRELYPDISPTLLKNTPDDQIEEVVAEQRKIAQEHYKGADVFLKPNYSSISDVDKDIESVKNNPKLSGLDKATEIMRLNNIKNSITPH